MQAAKQFEAAIGSIPELEVVGSPDMCNVAFRSTSPAVNVYAVNDLMSQRGWHLNALQRPAAAHMCFTAQHVDVVDDLVKVRSETAGV